ncbi:peptide chain release factor N(5)-glutamine methyltransferase [Lutimaribacter sp. EGI FJ00015]|uniref:Peptide chain release factor N(5)-glutamine methyltransferase n=1 Tax=Lutimaribacter degradans TaxID=2945989 RepID=A0ACC5ZSB9_9RHOB|nr:peptide chain release factor N(5)-glutamine methyltransferase [Lutimaribacter sp. EGI FJ00013]MCM2561218.1 peptide chain release factor N(5)-glutamine methyltransferase [Lutimaribacter sp. EGI FJ00013]MCO0611833.1 peptide chain release factor N(5)-glutamine methyltransferase [Lutimaribacter sp. EGI FJ00015]MCO0635046.1 peptide chain release factor N(5)-glutamine methyltransferase [Lutimaribacter sp. EGI FJ00014]
MSGFFARGRLFDLEESDQERLNAAAVRLRDAGLDNARGEAQMLWASVFATDGRDRGAALQEFDHRVGQRAARMPMSHILGGRDFFAHRFAVTADVLDPRPETETLVSLALERPWTRVLDLGTGSGAIVISLLAARAGASGMGTDLSQGALEIAAQNARQIGVADRLALRQGAWFDAVPGDAVFDLIVSNPPYISSDEMSRLAPELSFEPRMALTDEGDGLSAYRAICARAAAHLSAGAPLMVEIGHSQGAAVAALFDAAGFRAVRVLPDLDGRDRVVTGDAP